MHPPESNPPRPAKGMNPRATRRAVWILAFLALALAATLLRPVRCDGCGGWTVHPRATRLAPGWRVCCPEARLTGARPILCPACFRRLLEQSPARDEESRKVLRRYLTDPAAPRRILEALGRAKPK